MFLQLLSFAHLHAQPMTHRAECTISRSMPCNWMAFTAMASPRVANARRWKPWFSLTSADSTLRLLRAYTRHASQVLASSHDKSFSKAWQQHAAPTSWARWATASSLRIAEYTPPYRSFVYVSARSGILICPPGTTNSVGGLASPHPPWFHPATCRGSLR